MCAARTMEPECLMPSKLKIMLHSGNRTDLGTRASNNKGLTQPKGVSLRGPKCNI